MLPEWADTLDAAERYVCQWAEQFGGDLDPRGGPTFVDLPDAGDGAARVQVRPLEVRLPGEVVLTVRAVLRDDGARRVTAERYAFHLRRHGSLVWRYCRNDHHLDTDGVDTHVHLADGRREPSPPAPFEFVADLVRVELLD